MGKGGDSRSKDGSTDFRFLTIVPYLSDLSQTFKFVLERVSTLPVTAGFCERY
jgi:hypothetical protein